MFYFYKDKNSNSITEGMKRHDMISMKMVEKLIPPPFDAKKKSRYVPANGIQAVGSYIMLGRGGTKNTFLNLHVVPAGFLFHMPQ